MKIRAIITVAIEVSSDESWEEEYTAHDVNRKANYIVNKEVNNLLKSNEVSIERQPTIKLIKISK